MLFITVVVGNYRVFSDLLKELSSKVTPNHHLLKIQKVYLKLKQPLYKFNCNIESSINPIIQVYLSTCPWPEVQSELLLMTAYKVYIRMLIYTECINKGSGYVIVVSLSMLRLYSLSVDKYVATS